MNLISGIKNKRVNYIKDIFAGIIIALVSIPISRVHLMLLSRKREAGKRRMADVTIQDVFLRFVPDYAETKNFSSEQYMATTCILKCRTAEMDDFNRLNGKDKLCDFAYDFYHRDMIIKYSEKKICERYESWTKKKGYRFKEDEARQLYQIAKESIPTLEATENTKLIVQESVKVLKEVNASLFTILTRMTELAKQMPEYNTVMEH